MNNKQKTNKQIEIISKFEEPNWTIEIRGIGESLIKDWVGVNVSQWNWRDYEYRAVRIEKVETRTPFDIDFYKIGMQICTKNEKNTGIVYRKPIHPYVSFVAEDMKFYVVLCNNIASWRWPKDNDNGVGWNNAYEITTHEEVVEKIEIDNEV